MRFSCINTTIWVCVWVWMCSMCFMLHIRVGRPHWSKGFWELLCTQHTHYSLPVLDTEQCHWQAFYKSASINCVWMNSLYSVCWCFFFFWHTWVQQLRSKIISWKKRQVDKNTRWLSFRIFSWRWLAISVRMSHYGAGGNLMFSYSTHSPRLTVVWGVLILCACTTNMCAHSLLCMCVWLQLCPLPVQLLQGIQTHIARMLFTGVFTWIVLATIRLNRSI